MARFCGMVGFIKPELTAPSVYRIPDKPIEKKYYGDVLRNNRQWERGEGLNDNIVVNNSFSIVADSYAIDNLQYMKYIKYLGVAWRIKTIDIERPRLIITVGGIYNELQT